MTVNLLRLSFDKGNFVWWNVSCCGFATQINQGGSSYINWLVGQAGRKDLKLRKENQR
jgi:hypothetical protein